MAASVPKSRQKDASQAVPSVSSITSPSSGRTYKTARKPVDVRSRRVNGARAEDDVEGESTGSELDRSPKLHDPRSRRYDQFEGKKHRAQHSVDSPSVASPNTEEEDEEEEDPLDPAEKAWRERCQRVLRNLPKGVDEAAAKQILNEIVIHGDEVHWSDVAGLEVAKSALKETVVYPFLRPDLFMGLREPARGMLLFGPPGTGKTMLARAVATESRSTFFAISASSLTSKFLGESEKLVRALFSLAKALAPSIIFVDEIDSLLSARSGSGEHEATRRIKTEFLIQWSDLAKAAAGKEQTEKDRERGDASRVLVLAATNLPWAIDEAARRRFVRRQYIPLPEDHVRRSQLENLLSHQKQELSQEDLDELVQLTDGRLYAQSFSSIHRC
jgi:fidgetin-like protein 1